jgi:hypothetical protein
VFLTALAIADDIYQEATEPTVFGWVFYAETGSR